jgi:MOSC domain-containing protein YiiM
MPRILATSRSDQHGFSKQPHPELRLIAGEGIEGDAHRGATVQHLYLKRKNPTAPNLCQVHLFASEKLAELSALGFLVNPGDLGENLLTEGLDLLALPLGTHLHLGPNPDTGPLLEVTGLRTPCTQIEAFRPGLQQQLYGPPRPGTIRKTLRAGIMSIVLRGGLVHPNDALHLTLPPEPHKPLGPV